MVQTISMGRKLFIYLMGWGLPGYLLAQVPRQELVLTRNKLQAATSDSARFKISMDLSQAYRFSNIDSALYYTDRAIEISRVMNDPAKEADGLSRAAVARLFRDELPPIEVIKWRDLYTYLEDTIDAAEDAAEAMERMYHKAN